MRRNARSDALVEILALGTERQCVLFFCYIYSIKRKNTCDHVVGSVSFRCGPALTMGDQGM